ncbi:MAG: hypothetical protein C4523_19430 [Myxococcales bacterium]|nr:MAG: hypothetical protein C4523_19430 [Myxococcales bacterium]
MTHRAIAHAEIWTVSEKKILDRLDSPFKIQRFLDGLEYSADPIYRSPREVMRDRKAHCVDGSLFAAAALARLGFPPLIMELQAVRDDDHLIALFKGPHGLGAVAKSNFVTLRFREPVFRSRRELVMSYFEGYFNTVGEKTLRAYSVPLDLRRFDRLGWRTDAAAVDAIVARIESARHYPVAPKRAIDALSPVDPRSLEAAMLGSNPAGLFDPTKDSKG